jgi:ribosomal protein uS17
MADKNENQTDETPEEPVAEETPVADAVAPVEPEEAAVPEAEPEGEPEPVAEAAAKEPAAEAEPEPVAEAAAEQTAAEVEPEEPAAEAEAPAAEEPAAPAAPPEPKKKAKRLPRALRPQKTRPTRERATTRKPIVRLEKPEHERGRHQERRGVVVSDAMDKTIVVKVDTIKAHPKYKKVVRRSIKFHAHDEQNAAKIGDVVRIVETRPLSKTKRWRLAEVVEEAK